MAMRVYDLLEAQPTLTASLVSPFDSVTDWYPVSLQAVAVLTQWQRAFAVRQSTKRKEAPGAHGLTIA